MTLRSRVRQVERLAHLDRERVVPIVIGHGDVERLRKRVEMAAERGRKLNCIRIVVRASATDEEQAREKLSEHLDRRGTHVPLEVYREGTCELLCRHEPASPDWLQESLRVKE